jgi:Holliday junction resolvase RusA-like endonuclease
MLAHPTRTKTGRNGIALRYPPAVIAWRSQVSQAALEAKGDSDWITGPVELRLGFDMPRPLNHFGTGKKTAGLVKPTAPVVPIVAPDLDKLIRAICDSLTDAGLYRDDSQVVTITAAKRYCPEGQPPGVHIVITELL